MTGVSLWKKAGIAGGALLASFSVWADAGQTAEQLTGEAFSISELASLVFFVIGIIFVIIGIIKLRALTENSQLGQNGSGPFGPIMYMVVGGLLSLVVVIATTLSYDSMMNDGTSSPGGAPTVENIGQSVNTTGEDDLSKIIANIMPQFDKWGNLVLMVAFVSGIILVGIGVMNLKNDASQQGNPRKSLKVNLVTIVLGSLLTAVPPMLIMSHDTFFGTDNGNNREKMDFDSLNSGGGSNPLSGFINS